MLESTSQNENGRSPLVNDEVEMMNDEVPSDPEMGGCRGVRDDAERRRGAVANSNCWGVLTCFA
jgi:hypothetical protein